MQVGLTEYDRQSEIQQNDAQIKKNIELDLKTKKLQALAAEILAKVNARNDVQEMNDDMAIDGSEQTNPQPMDTEEPQEPEVLVCNIDELEEVYQTQIDNALKAPRRNILILIVAVYSRAHLQSHQSHNDDKRYGQNKEDEIIVSVIELKRNHENKLGYGLVIAFAVIGMVGGAVSIGSAGLGFAGKFSAKGLERAGQIGSGISTVGQSGMHTKDIATAKKEAARVVLEDILERLKRKRGERTDSANQEDQQSKRLNDELLQALKNYWELTRDINR